MRVGVFGAGGRMGATVCRAVANDPELELVAAVDPHHAGLDLRQVTGADAKGVQVQGHADALASEEAQVAVDFTERDAAVENLAWCADHGVHAVVGTTGLTPADLEQVGRRFPPGGPANCWWRPTSPSGRCS